MKLYKYDDAELQTINLLTPLSEIDKIEIGQVNFFNSEAVVRFYIEEEEEPIHVIFDIEYIYGPGEYTTFDYPGYPPYIDICVLNNVSNDLERRIHNLFEMEDWVPDYKEQLRDY